jgi:hypothetical protein
MKYKLGDPVVIISSSKKGTIIENVGNYYRVKYETPENFEKFFYVESSLFSEERLRLDISLLRDTKIKRIINE